MADQDNVATDLNMKANFEQEVRERAYYLWEKEGISGGQVGDDYWHRAFEERLRDRAFELWQQDGSPEGKEVDYLDRLRALLSG
jgi:hypothetical protein